ncbi:hypothetical protein GGD68_006275 [Paraburkholderia fungorum]|uniref:Uncharacterized protein n=1 Tax=Paraburkholderia fungorum TaxID=134537 RepID=A0AAW3V444_9BURK|nr:hypothetical protein [Paraburkholderia fungorum]MBB6204540.1 hypothetical protein [Paraburkholderia fungorum]
MMRRQASRSLPRQAGAVRSTLHDDVRKAFERACSENDFEVAEYLLRTLEAIARRELNDSSLDRAYRVLAHCLAPS